jgi:hypothetical protein
MTALAVFWNLMACVARALGYGLGMLRTWPGSRTRLIPQPISLTRRRASTLPNQAHDTRAGAPLRCRTRPD